MTIDGRCFRADVVAGKSRPGDVVIVKVQGSAYAPAFSASAGRRGQLAQKSH